jgi:hypothetical protein
MIVTRHLSTPEKKSEAFTREMIYLMACLGKFLLSNVDDDFVVELFFSKRKFAQNYIKDIIFFTY